MTEQDMMKRYPNILSEGQDFDSDHRELCRQLMQVKVIKSIAVSDPWYDDHTECYNFDLQTELGDFAFSIWWIGPNPKLIARINLRDELSAANDEVILAGIQSFIQWVPDDQQGAAPAEVLRVIVSVVFEDACHNDRQFELRTIISGVSIDKVFAELSSWSSGDEASTMGVNIVEDMCDHHEWEYNVLPTPCGDVREAAHDILLDFGGRAIARLTRND